MTDNTTNTTLTLTPTEAEQFDAANKADEYAERAVRTLPGAGPEVAQVYATLALVYETRAHRYALNNQVEILVDTIAALDA